MNSKAIIGVISGVTKKWAKQRKAEKRKASAASRRREVWDKSYRITVKDAAYGYMETAYLKASGNGTLPALARQIMYAARGHVQEEAGRPLNADYFTQTLLPDYMNDQPSKTASWDVVFDARGHLYEPHTGLVVPLGTLDVRGYLNGNVKGSGNGNGDPKELDLDYPTHGPDYRYGAIMFVEKEGFGPLFKAAELAERYDLAIMSTKGLSTTAARLLVDNTCGGRDIPLLILRDFDKAGFSIAATLQNDTRRYSFRYPLNAIDLGLRLEDVEACGLESESVYYGKSDPQWNLRENGATPEEIAFLYGGYRQGRRVELNAFASDQLIEWLEAKLERHGIKKVVPDRDTLKAAYRRAIQLHFINTKNAAIAEEAEAYAESVKVPRGLAKRINGRLAECPSTAWDAVIADLVRKAEADGD